MLTHDHSRSLIAASRFRRTGDRAPRSGSLGMNLRASAASLPVTESPAGQIDAPAAPALRREAVPVLVLTLIALVHAWMRTVRDPDYFAGDILTQFLPYYGLIGDRLASFDLPGWNPAIFSGMPLAGDPISGWGYLPVMSVFPFFSPETAYRVHVGVHYIGAALAAYAFARVLGMSKLGAFAAGSAFLLGPHYHFAQCCTARMQVTPWIPLAMLGFELAIRARTAGARIGWWGLTGFAFSQMIAGYFGKGFYYGILFCGAFLAYRVLIDRSDGSRSWRLRLLWLGIHSAVTIALALLFSAITLLPRLDFLAVSNLDGGSYEAVGEGAALSPAWPVERTLSSLLSPAANTYYVGLVAVGLSIAALVLCGRRFAAPFWALAGASIVILTLDTTPLHELFYLIPRFQTIHEHQPQRILVVFNIAPAMLAGAAITTIQVGSVRARRYLLAAAVVVGSYIGCAAVIRGADLAFTWQMWLSVFVVVAALACIAALPKIASRTRVPVHRLALFTAVILTVMLIADLDRARAWDAIRQGPSTPPQSAIARSYIDPLDLGGAGEFLRSRMASEGPFRYFGYDADYLQMPPDGGGGRNYRLQWRNPAAEELLLNNRAITLELQDIQGYNPVHYMAYREWFIVANRRAQEYHEQNVLTTGIGSPLFDLLNARYIVVPSAIPPGRPDLLHLHLRHPVVFENGSVRVLENLHAAPRVWVAGNMRLVNSEESMSLLSDDAIAVAETVLLQEAPGIDTPPISPLVAGTASFASYEPDRIVVNADLTQPGYLVLNEPFDHGWKAWVDGKPVPVLQANVVMRAVIVPAGSHVVVFAYEPAALTLGLWVTIAAAAGWLLLLLATLFAYPRWARRRLRLTTARSESHALPGRIGLRTLDWARDAKVQDAMAIGLLLIAIATKTWERIAFNGWTARVDVLGQYLPWWSYLGEGLRSFDIPGWNPHQFGGTPFLGDPQSGWLYAPVMLLFTALPPLVAINAYVGLHLLIGGVSLYALARVVGLAPIGAFAAAVAFTFGPFIHHTTYCCNIQGHLAAWLPSALLGVELGLRSETWGKRLGWFLLTGFAISQFNAGWIGQGSYNGMLVVGTFILYRTLVSPVRSTPHVRDRALSLVLNGALVLIIGAGLSAAAVLPRLDANAETNLAGGNYENVEDVDAREGATLATVLNRLVNSDDDTVRRTYIGAVTLALALLALLFTRRSPVPFFAGLAVVPILLTMETTPLHQLFYLLPRFQEIHEHDRIRVLSVYMIGASMLAGTTVDQVFRGVRPRRLLAGGLVLTPFVWLWRFGLPERLRDLFDLQHPLLKTLLLVSVVLIGLAIALRYRPRMATALRPLAAAALVVLLLWEPAGREFFNTLTGPPVPASATTAIKVMSADEDPGGAGEFLHTQLATGPPYRYFGYQGGNLRTAERGGLIYHSERRSPLYQPLLLTARPIQLGLYDVQGYNPVQLQHVVDLFRSINGEPLNYHDAVILRSGWDSPWLDVLGVRYVVISDRPESVPEVLHLQQTVAGQFPTVFSNGDVRVIERPSAFSRAWLVHDTVEMDAVSAHAAIENGTVNAALTAIVEPGASLPALAAPAESRTESVTVTTFARDQVVLQATVTASAVLVVSDMYSDAWHATVHGEAVELFRVDGSLMGIALPPGEHTVTFTYAPRSIPLGLAISGITILIVGLIALALARTPIAASNFAPRTALQPATMG